jgi:hypothetical protein
MTIRERLQVEIQELTEAEAATVLAFLEEQKHERARGPWPPSFADIGHSGRSDLADRSEDILRTEFGSR